MAPENVSYGWVTARPSRGSCQTHWQPTAGWLGLATQPWLGVFSFLFEFK